MCLYFLADSVYLPEENQREEYVRNDFGLLYQGTAKNISFKPWGFDQVKAALVCYLKGITGYMRSKKCKTSFQMKTTLIMLLEIVYPNNNLLYKVCVCVTEFSVLKQSIMLHLTLV